MQFRRLVTLTVGAAVLFSGVIVIAPGASAYGKQCSEVTQPVMGEPTLDASGAVFTWSGGDRPYTGTYSLSVGRYVNGVTSWDSFFQAREELHEYGVPWVKDGVRADGIALTVGIYCVDGQTYPYKWAYFSDWNSQSSGTAGSQQSAADGDFQKALIDAAVAAAIQELQQPVDDLTLEELDALYSTKTVKCISKTTFKKKQFTGKWAKRQKCPKGWVKI